MTRKVYLRSKNNEYKYNSRYRRHTKKIVQSGGDQTTYSAYVFSDRFDVNVEDELKAALNPYEADAKFKKENGYEIRGIPTKAINKTKLFLLNTKGIPPKNIGVAQNRNMPTQFVDLIVFSDTKVGVDDVKKIEGVENPNPKTAMNDPVVEVTNPVPSRVKITVTTDTSKATNVFQALNSGNLKQLSFDVDKSPVSAPTLKSYPSTLKSYTIEAPPNDTDALEREAKKLFGDDKVDVSPIKQSVSGSGITVNADIENLKKIKIKDKNGTDIPLEISSQSPADGGTIRVKTPYKIVNIDDYDKSDLLVGTVKYVDVIPNDNVTQRLDEFLNGKKKQGVLQTKGTNRMFISDASIKTSKNLTDYPELGGATYIGLKLPTKSSKVTVVSEMGNDAYGTKQFTQTITDVGADIIGELKHKGLDVEIKGNDMIVTPTTLGINIDKIVNIDDYSISVPDGTVKYVDVFTNPSQGIMGIGMITYLEKKQSEGDGILKIKGTGNDRTASFISDESIRKGDLYKAHEEVRSGKTYLALKIPTSKVEEPAVRLTTIKIDDNADIEKKKKLSEFLIQNSYKIEKKPENLLKALNVMPTFNSDGFDDKTFDELYNVLIGDNDGLKVKGPGLFSKFKKSPIITKPTDLPNKLSLYRLLVTLNKIEISGEKKNASAQFFNSLKEIFNSLYKDKPPSNPINPVESFIRKLYDPSYSQTNTEKYAPVLLSKTTYNVARDVANLVIEKINKRFATEGGRLTRKKVLKRRNKKKSHRSKIN
jgi:hypothetical protein